jgi:type I restriction enzyme S subunit
MKSVALSKVAKIIMGQSPPSSTYNTVGEGLPFFQGKADFGDLYPTVRMFCNKPQKVAEVGDILISVRAPVGPTNISPEKSCIGRGLAAIRNSKDLDSRYLLYFLRFYEPELAEVGKGSTFSAISRSDLERIQVPFPPLPEQKRIAAILAKADRLRRLRRTARDLSDTYLQSVFLEMFGDPVSNPRGWEVRPLRSTAIKFQDGPFGSNLKTEHYTSSGVRVIRLQNVGVGQLINDDKAYISESHFAAISKHKCVPGDVIVGTLGDPNLRACILPGSIPVALNKADCVQIRVDSEQATPEFICWLLNVPHTLFLAIGMIHGQTRSRISMGQLARLEVPIPPLPFQQQFAHIVHQFERLRAQQREAQRQAEHLFQTLLHRAFRGELGDPKGLGNP